MGTAARRTDKKQKSLSDVFNAFAQDSAARFPAVKGKLLIHDTNENASYGREALSKKSPSAQAAIDGFLRKRLKSKNLMTYAEKGNYLKLAFILYAEPVNQNEIKDLSAKTEKDILFLLDHELAHLVIKDPPLAGENAQYKESVAEAIADAYALMRHYQRYGTQSSHKNTIIDPWARAGALTLNGDTIHFSTLMLEEIIKRKDVIDFASLDPQQTAELARRFALAYTPPASTVNNILNKLKPVQKIHINAPDSNRWLKALARIALDPKSDAYTFKICKKILDGYLDGRTDMDGQSFNTNGAYWDNIRAELKAAEERHARDDILFNIPQMQTEMKPKRKTAPKRKPQ